MYGLCETTSWIPTFMSSVWCVVTRSRPKSVKKKIIFNFFTIKKKCLLNGKVNYKHQNHCEQITYYRICKNSSIKHSLIYSKIQTQSHGEQPPLPGHTHCSHSHCLASHAESKKILYSLYQHQTTCLSKPGLVFLLFNISSLWDCVLPTDDNCSYQIVKNILVHV